MKTATNKTHIPEDIATDILARLPLRSIKRFKSVCKTWKSLFESVLFRGLFLSLHQNSSCSWSLTDGPYLWEEFIGFYGCETWDLPKSLVSYIPNFPDFKPGKFGCYAYSNGFVLMEGIGYRSYVGNPVLQQWLRIPGCPCNKCTWFGFVTRVDEDGVVLSFKVVRRKISGVVCIYSSEIGIWTSKRLHIPPCVVYSSEMSLNGMLYFLSAGSPRSGSPQDVIAHDFYSQSDQFRATPLPEFSSHECKGALTTSRGYLMYIQVLARNNEIVLKAWRLNNVGLENQCWQVLWEIPLSFVQSNDIRYYAPMTMHPFDSDIVYIWNQRGRCLMSLNVRTQNYTTLRGALERYNDGCFMNQTICQWHMDWIFIGSEEDDIIRKTTLALSQFVLPRWMESVPCPPHVETIDTTSILSFIASVEKAKRDKERKGKSVMGSR